MTKEEAKARAEEIVYVYCNLGDILYRCKIAGIETHTPKGKQRSRGTLETELIEYYTKYYSEN